MLESRGTGREVDSSDRVGIFDRQLKVKALKESAWRGCGGRVLPVDLGQAWHEEVRKVQNLR